MIKKIVSFDFDNTLINTPTPENGKPLWEKFTGLSWTKKDWWGSAESLNLNVFSMEVNKWVYEKYLESISNPNNYVIIATGRRIKLQNQVRKILDLHDIKSDLFCNTGGDTLKFKCNLFQSLMKKLNADELTMFDDRQEHLIEFIEWAKKMPFKTNIIDVVNKNQIF